MKNDISFQKKMGHRKNRRGQGFVEYICLVGLIALLIYATIKTFGNAVGGAFNNMTNAVQDASNFSPE